MAVLSAKQEQFCREYVIDFNGAAAARRAGYSEHTAHEQAARLLARASIKSRVDQLTRRLVAKQEITAERVLAELARLAFHDPRKFFNPDGSLKAITDLDDDTAKAVTGMDVDEIYASRGDERVSIGRTKRLKLADKGQNLERLGRYLKLFTDKVEHSGEIGVTDRLLSARKRVSGSQDDREREA